MHHTLPLRSNDSIIPFSDDVISEWPLTNVAGEINPGFVEGTTWSSAEKRILKHQHQDHHKKGKTSIFLRIFDKWPKYLKLFYKSAGILMRTFEIVQF